MKFVFSLVTLFLVNLCCFEVTGAENVYVPNGTQQVEDEQNEDVSEMLELMDILEEETTIATKTKMNSDYVPGMVTVLHGNEMQALGKLNVWEALILVPGLKPFLSDTGTPQLITRGIPFPFNSGNIKIMLNNTTISSEISGINSSVLLIPIAQVERIEFIRGPSSSIHGNSAYMGLVNIVTRKETKQLHVNAQDGKSVGGAYYWSDPENNFHISANLVVQRDGGANAPRNIDIVNDQSSLIVAMDYEQTSFAAQWFERKYKTEGVLQLPLVSEEQAVSFVLKQKAHLSNSLDGEIQLSYYDNKFKEIRDFQGSVTQAKMNLNWNLFEKHKLFMEISAEHHELDSATLCLANIPGAGSPPGPPCPPNFNSDRVLRNKHWNNYNLSIHDQYAMSDNFSIMGGLGIHKNTNNNESNISPRLAVVWKMAEHHLFKGQYSRGFRSPTYFELYDVFSNRRNLGSEQVESYELGYNYKINDLLGRITMFYSSLDNLIFPEMNRSPDGMLIFDIVNSAQGKTIGIELEWEQKINKFFKWSFNVSYADSKDNRGSISGVAPLGSSNWLGNVTFLIKPKVNMLITTQYYYVGEQAAFMGNIDGYNKLDVTFNLYQFMHKKITLRAGIKNVLDDTILYSSPAPGTVMGSTVEYSGRSWWAEMSYQF